MTGNVKIIAQNDMENTIDREKDKCYNETILIKWACYRNSVLKENLLKWIWRMNMKKFLTLALAFLMLVACMGTTGLAADREGGVDYLDDITAVIPQGVILYVDTNDAIVDGVRVKVDPENSAVMPVVIDSRTLVPVRFIAESIGAQVGWEDVTQSVTVTLGDTTIALRIGDKNYTINGQPNELDVPAITINDRTMLPLRATVEALGKEVSWDDRGLIGICDEADIFTGSAKGIVDRIIATFGIFVAPNGSDSNSGTKEKPLKTLDGARNTVRSLKTKTGIPQGGLTVYFRDGEYPLTNTVSFTADDSSKDVAPITYKAYLDEQVNFNGSVTINGDKFVNVTNEATKARLYPSVTDKVMQLNLKDQGITNYGSIMRANPNTRTTADTTAIYVDGAKQTLARWPNDDYAKTGSIIQSGQSSLPAAWYVEEDNIMRWGRARDAWVYGYWYWDWYDDSMKISTIDTKEKTITTEYGSESGVARGKRYMVFNLLEEIDMPGEWYIDSGTGILYYYPIAESMAGKKIQLTTLTDVMMSFKGTANVNFEGITFEASAHGAINASGVSNMQFARSTFRNLGGEVAKIDNATNTGFAGCNVYNTSKGGFIFNNCGNRVLLTNSNCYVENSYFTLFNTVNKTNTPAIAVGSSCCGMRITNNVIHHGAHSGITFSGNESVFANNELYDLCRESSDSGAGYGGRDWTSQGLVFNNNILHDIYGVDGHGAHSLYYDDGQSGEIITSNIFYNVFTPAFVHGGRDFVMDSNIVANSLSSLTIINLSGGQNASPMQELFDRYQAVPVNSAEWKAKYPRLSNYLNDEAWLPKNNTITRTISYNSPNVSYPESAKATGTFTDNIETSDASLFKDAANNDFTLVKDPGIQGFVAPDPSIMGLKMDNYRKSLVGINDFHVTGPYDGERNVAANRLTLRWETAIGATYYTVRIATDREMNDVVFDAETTNTAIELHTLDYGNKAYYWQIEAVNTSVFDGSKKLNVGDIAIFYTAQSEVIDKTELENVIKDAENAVKGADVGDKIGQNTPQSKEKLDKAIADAKVMLTNPSVRQVAIDALVADMRKAIEDFVYGKVVGNIDLGTLIKDTGNWIASNPNFMRVTPTKISLTTTGNFQGLGYRFAQPNYPIWTFKIKSNSPGGKILLGMRVADPTAVPWSTVCYLIGGSEGGFTIQRFNNGGADLMSNQTKGLLSQGKEHVIEISSLDVAEGVRLIMKVDGQMAFDYLDTDGYIADMGCFALYGYANETVEIMPAGDSVMGSLTQ